MPRNRKNKWNKNNNQSKDYDKSKDKYATYDIIVKENASFEKYYKQLGLIEENEFESFIETLKKPLPITFRITSYKSFTSEVLNLLKQKHFKYIDEITKNNEKLIEASANKHASLLTQSSTSDEEIYKCLSWYPNELAWQVELSRQDVKKNVHFDEFKQFLIQQTESGHINRQEAVSMIPPLLLDANPNHKILDMCASPGNFFVFLTKNAKLKVDLIV